MPQTTVFRIADDMQFDLNVVLSDRVGNPLGDLPAGSVPTFTSSDPSVLTVTPHTDNAAVATVATTGKLGTGQISVSVPNPAKPDTPMVGMLDIEVVPGEASNLALTPTNLQSRTIS